MEPRLRIALLFGGRSAEHDVSCVSAVAVANALDPDRYEVVPIGITAEGRWLAVPPGQLAVGAAGELARGLQVGGEPVTFTSDPKIAGGLVALGGAGAAGAAAGIEAVDIVFPLLHGPMGEDGTVQGMCELAGVPYVGAGHTASAVCMDKVMSKRVLLGAGMDVARFVEVREPAWRSRPNELRTAIDGLGYPVFVKPANLGSSVGITKAKHPAELHAAVAEALSYDPVAIVEETIAGRELEVAILGDDDPAAAGPGEIIAGREFYDFTDKYIEDGAQLLIPAPLDDATAKACREVALAAYRVLGIEGMARVDLFLSLDPHDATRELIYVNEVNTIPGFTPISMFPKLWEAGGVGYGELCDRLVRLALEKHERRSRIGRPRGAR